jgi:molybdopterin-guanine dinucleotide biosynthesis protein A
MYEPITAIILSGGKSTRMGTNKSLLKLGNKTLIEIVSERCKNLFSNTLLITNQPEIYSCLNLSMFGDIHLGMGPMAGLHTGLQNSKTEKNFLISCDVPFLDEEAIRFLIESSKDAHCFVPRASGYVQHLCGIYNKSLLPIIENLLTENSEQKEPQPKCKMGNLIKISQGIILDMEKEYPNYRKELFDNLNTPEDYEKARIHWASGY